MDIGMVISAKGFKTLTRKHSSQWTTQKTANGNARLIIITRLPAILLSVE
jgi:hypothetical protein